MTIGVVGQKRGMTRIFTENGSIPVTVIEVLPNRITQIKTLNKDGYTAIQVTSGIKPVSRLNKPMLGHYAKNEIEPGLGLWEFRLTSDELLEQFSVGTEIPLSLFTEGQKVDVSGISKGKGFQGGVKRHNFRTQDATHGNSVSHRVIGSTGQNQTPGRVFKGKKMPGQMGNVRRTIQAQEIIRVYPDKHVLLVKGGIPGSKGGRVIIKPSVKVAQSNQIDKNQGGNK